MPEILAAIARDGAELVAADRYVEEASAYRSTARRTALDRLLADAARGALRGAVLYIWALDRLCRQGVRRTLEILDALKAYGIAVKAIKDPWLDTRSDSPLGELLLVIFASLARLESLRLSDRIKAGLARAVAEGRKLGRPAAAVDADHVRRLLGQGHGVRAIARTLKVGIGTAQKWIARVRGTENVQEL